MEVAVNEALSRFLPTLLFAALASRAQTSGIIGNWKTPLGSVIHFDHCGQQICSWILVVSPTAPSTKDIHNPDSSLHDRLLCGMKIGTGFTLNTPTTASGGLCFTTPRPAVPTIQGWPQMATTWSSTATMA